MPSKPRAPQASSSRKQPVERRSNSAAAGDDSSAALRKVKGALQRPLGLARKDGQLRLVLVERRRTPPADQPPVLARIVADLRERLEDLTDTPAERLMRHLGLVAGELERQGWSRVGALPASVLGRALTQAEMLAGEARSDLLAIFVERLRQLEAAAARREELLSTHQRPFDDATLVVSEATHEEFEASRLSWADSLGNAPAPPPAEPPDPAVTGKRPA